ncbi:MAG: S1/P1 nuclease [Candidatus Cyclobacteriaceae bacterium M3_2C_046]
MKNKRCIPILVLIFTWGFPVQAAASALLWGQTGHRTIGWIAEQHLTKKARKNIEKVLGHESLAMASTWMDFIKSDPEYHFMDPWHYATIPEGKTYEQAGIPEEGDVIQTIHRLIRELKTKQFEFGNEAMALKSLIHLVGDIHQPLHVGKGTDRGGNDIAVTFFGEPSNLHRVWDSGIIDAQKLSYTEYGQALNQVSPQLMRQWQAASILDWAKESQELHGQVYDLTASKKISYDYNFKNLEGLNLRLLQAGVRLAGLLNQIYG